MNIKKKESETMTIFSLTGTLDTNTAPQLEEVLIPEFEKVKHIELDFSELEYVSSAGLRVLLMGTNTAEAKDSKFEISGVSEEIMEIFEMTGFSDILTII